jgi:hypothetical protein
VVRALRRTGAAAAIAVSCVLAAGVATAAADRSVLPVGGASSSADPAQSSPLEALLTRLATHIAGGRTVALDCYSTAAWSAAGYGGAWGEYMPANARILLAPQTCAYLAEFAAAPVKPTKCASTVTETAASRAAGIVLGIRPAPLRRPARSTRPGAPVPCYRSETRTWLPHPLSTAVPWSDFAWAMLSLGHEAVHVIQYGAGLPFAQVEATADSVANCWGMQWIPWIAEQLGDTSDDAAALAHAVFDLLYPELRSAPDSVEGPQWSAECRPGGALDLHLDGAAAWR